MPISGNEMLVLLVLAALLIGPERLPKYAEQVARLVRQVKAMASDAQSRISDDLGPEFKDVDWSQLDPRRYDPRRIVREALLDPDPRAGAKPAPAPPPSASSARSTPQGAKSDLPDWAPFDDEAT